MDTYNNSYTTYSDSSSSSSSYRSYGNNKPPVSRSVLHSVRNKVPFKHVITKKPIAPLPPIPPKVYKIDAVDFRDVVQKLTGAPEFVPTRLRDVAPPPLRLSPPVFYPTLMMQSVTEELATDDVVVEEEKCHKSCDVNFGTLSPLGFSLSPNTLAWCSSIMLSPGTLSAFEPSAVL